LCHAEPTAFAVLDNQVFKKKIALSNQFNKQITGKSQG